MCIGYTCIHYVSYMFINAEIFRDHEYLKMYISELKCLLYSH